jgi:predicted RNase H-like nuclease
MGWDAAWTPKGSGDWCVVRNGELLLWEVSPKGTQAVKDSLESILEAFRPDLVAMDMPIGKKGVKGYREADRATTRAFSRYGCPVHSPTPERPGAWGQECVEVLLSYGFHICTAPGEGEAGIAEVYPHTALLDMKRLSYRFPYKVTRCRNFWPECTPMQARSEARKRLKEIYEQLAESIALPPWTSVEAPLSPLRALKEVEDRVDALICAWAGLRILSNHFVPYGNEEAAIWNPNLNILDPPRRTQ